MGDQAFDANKDNMTIERMCKLLEVSISGYYLWKNRALSTFYSKPIIWLRGREELNLCSSGHEICTWGTLDLGGSGFGVL